NVSDLIEIAARDELMRRAGHDSSREFLARVDRAAAESSAIDAARNTVHSDPPHLSESSVPPPLSQIGRNARPADTSSSHDGAPMIIPAPAADENTASEDAADDDEL